MLDKTAILDRVTPSLIGAEFRLHEFDAGHIDTGHRHGVEYATPFGLIPHRAADLIALFQQLGGHMTANIAGDSGDKYALSHRGFLTASIALVM